MGPFCWISATKTSINFVLLGINHLMSLNLLFWLLFDSWSSFDLSVVALIVQE